MPTRSPFAPLRSFAASAAVACIVAGYWTSSVLAVNRFTIPAQSLPIGTTGALVPVRADLDQDIYGFSVHIQYDASKINVTAVQAGSAITALAPEFSDGTITNSPGRIVWGVVFDTSNPITKKLTPGTGKELLKLQVNVLAASATTALLDVVNVPGNPSRLNVMTNATGDSVAPPPTLVDGTITITDQKPVIQSLTGNTGREGKEFLVVGLNFDLAGLAVNVCSKPAAFTLLGDNQTLQVTAPACAVGPAEVEVCNSFGCDSEPAGFTYIASPQPPIIDALFNNSGGAGKVFTVVGQNFTESGLTVKVCNVVASFTLLADNQTLQVTAPACGSLGFAPVEVCTGIGCDSEASGFEYTNTATLFVRGDANNDTRVDLSDPISILNSLFSGIPAAAPCADALDPNDDGKIDLSDAIYTLNYLFQGGAAIKPPYPGAGTDPTPDSLPTC